MSEPSDDLKPTRLVIKYLPTQAEIDAFVQAMDNCFLDNADNDATRVLARNTGTEILTEPKKRIEDYVDED